jgi:hypothetical protein
MLLSMSNHYQTRAPRRQNGAGWTLTVERSFAHVLDRGGMRRAWLRGRENVHKRYLIHVAGFNLGLLMRALFGAGAPRQASDDKNALLFAYQADDTLVFAIMAVVEGQLLIGAAA